MKQHFQTEQENFWANSFGKSYITRNNQQKLISSRVHWFKKIFSNTDNISSAIDFGANIGLNCIALKQLYPNLNLSALEINNEAVGHLKEIPDLNVIHQSLLEYVPDHTYDMVLIKGVLIHINPDHLRNAYEKLYHSSGKYICLMEYYNPTPVSIEYHGEKNKLFKRDFAGELMDCFKDLKLIDYGFIYHRDNLHPLDDNTWFLMEKK